MKSRRLHRVVGLVVAGAVALAACGGESADRDRNVDAVPATAVASGPQGRDLTFTETFADGSNKGAGTTASWGETPGALTMKSLGIDEGLAFDKVSWPALVGALSTGDARRYVGASEYIYSPSDKRGLVVLRAEVEEMGLGSTPATRLRGQSGTVAGTFDDVMQADLDNDGLPETIIAKSAASEIEITDGAGSKTVVSGIDDDEYIRERFVVADFTADGLPDIARVGRRVVLLAQLASTDGSIKFNEPAKAEVDGRGSLGSQPYSLSAGDLNGDGRADLVFTGMSGTTSNELTFLIADAREVGKFKSERVDVRGVTGGIRNVEVADIDGMPGNEVLVVTRENGVVHVTRTGSATLVPSVELTTPEENFAFAASSGDVNADGVADVAYLDGIGRIFVRLGVRGGSWANDRAAINLPGAIASPASASVRIRDVNGDGRNDVSIISGTAVDNFVARATNAAGTMRMTDQHDVDNDSGYGRSVLAEFVDVNLDGHRDVIMCSQEYRRACYVNLHSGSRTNPYGQATPIVIGDMASAISDIAVGDVTGDGWPDLAIASGKTIMILGNSRRPSTPFARLGIEQSVVLTKNVRSIAIAELTGDAYVDVVVGFTQGLSVLKGAARSVDPTTGLPTYVSTTETVIGTTAVVDDLYPADLDGNNPIDFVGPDGGTVRNWVRQGSSWSSDPAPVSFPSNQTSRPVKPVIADFTGDGRVDAVTVNDAQLVGGKPVVQFAAGKKGRGGFYAREVIGELPKSSFVIDGSRALDLNFDGLTDLAVPVRLGTRVAIYGIINQTSGGTASFAQTAVEFASVSVGNSGLVAVYPDFMNADRIIDMMIVGEKNYRFELSPMASGPIVYSAVDANVTLGGRQVEGLYPMNGDAASAPSVVATSTQTTKRGQSAVVLKGEKVVGRFSHFPAALGPQDRPITVAATGRLDSDAFDDVVVSRRFGIDIYTASNSANWGKVQALSPSEEIFDLSIGRLTTDGHADVVAATKNTRSTRRPGNPNNEPYVFLVPADRLDVVDINGDGLDDVVTLKQERLNVYLAINGPQILPNSPSLEIDLLQSRLESGPYGSGLIVDDVSGDGMVDALISTGGGQVIVLNGPLSESTKVGATNLVLNDNLWQMQLMDVNADGLRDIVGVKRPGEKPVAYLNSGNPGQLFNAKRTFDVSFAQIAAAGLGAIDLNRDGLDDIVVGTAAVGYSESGSLKSYLASVGGIYGTSPRIAVSKPLTDPTQRDYIEKVTLTATATTPAGSSVSFEMTNNGTDWYAVESGKSFTFPSNGAALAWRAKLASATGAVAPTVTKVVVAARAYVPPAPVASAQAVTGDASLTVQWVPGPAASGGVVKTYKVVDPEADEVKCVTTEMMCVVSGLQNGKTYALRVIAENPAGAVVTQVTGQLTPTALPTAPGKPVLKPIEGGFEVSWKAPSNASTDALVERYVVKFPLVDKECVSTTTTCTVTGLVPGTSYVATVAAANVRGQGAWSAMSDPAAPLGRPTIVSALASQVSVSPTLGGFRVSVPNGLFSTTGTGISELKLLIDGQVVCSTKKSTAEQPCGTASTELFLVSGLSKSGDGSAFESQKTYEFSLVGVNEAGESQPSPAISATYLGNIVDFAPTVQVGDGQLTVSWTPPANAGPNFTVTVPHPGDEPCVVTGTGTTSCVIDGLTNGSLVTMNYAASNGFSEVTGSVLGVPAPIPGKVGELAVATDGAQVAVKWTAPDNAVEARVSGYEVTLSPGGKKCEVAVDAMLSCDFTGVSRGQSYTVEVIANGAAGSGAKSSKSIVAATAPGRVMFDPIMIAETSIVLTWDPPIDNGGSEIVGYDVLVDGETLTITSPSVTLGDLSPGRMYSVTVAAKTAAGYAGEGTTVQVRPMGMPGAPKIVSVEQSADSVLLNVKAPTRNGGSAIVAYDCVVTRGSAKVVVEYSCGGPDGSVVVPRGDAAAGTKFDIAVIARNELLPGEPTEPTVVVLADKPGQIGSMSMAASADGLSYELTFDAPGDGGSPITGYELRVVNAITGEQLQAASTSASNRRFVVAPPFGVSVRVLVSAVNAIGAGPAASPFGTLLVYGPPSEPKISKLFAGDGEVYVEWDVPVSTGGAVIEAYTVEAVAESGTFLPSSIEIVDGFRGAVFRGLENGVVYRILVTVSTAGGDTTSTSDPIVPIGPPWAPSIFVDAIGDGFADVRWDVPVSTGGLPIDEYVITTTPEGGKCEAVDNRCRMTGLKNGVGYVVNIAARTQWGLGPEGISRSFTPLAVEVPAADARTSGPSDQPARVIVPNLSIVGGEGATSSQTGAGTTATTVVPPTTSSTTGAPRLLVGQKVALRALLAAFKVKLPAGAVALLDVKTAASKPCAVTKRFVTGRSAGQCRFTILVQPKKGKAKRVNVNVEVVAAKG